MKPSPRLKDFTKIPFFLFRIVGITIFEYDAADKQTFLRKVLGKVILANAAIHVVLEVAYPCVEKISDAIELIKFGCYMGYTVNAVLKFCVVVKELSLLHEVMGDLNVIYPSIKQDIVAYRVKEYYNEIQLLMWIVAGCHVAISILFILFPFCQSVSEYISYGNDFEKRFAYYTYIPLEMNQFVVYLVVFFFQHTSLSTMFIFFAGPDLLMFTTVHLMCMHLKYVAHKIENFEPAGTDEDIEVLNRFIAYHQFVLNLSFKINTVFNSAIFVNYLASGGVICLTAFHVTVGTHVSDLVRFGPFLALSLVYVYLICFFGTNLMEMSGEISQAVFSHKWYMGNAKYRKMMPLLIIRAQKPLVLSAHKFFTVSMESFTMVIKLSYQIFALLRTSYEDIEEI